ncbi:MAG: NUDIX domain-containing protein [Candidatus Shapirobacteria bacterium]|nr:NUDIX domain-containing protein [Candidatus Shapirobacteria bacterium]MDD4410440.1 NUDIX domain-containing protein [Candidatus Shapirobacteria bacterium]
MTIDRNTLNYRKSTTAVIVNKENKILLTQKREYYDNEWDFPGGGVEENETDEQTILRELYEELGTNKFIIIKKSSRIDKYEWPNEVVERKLLEKGKTWRGQQRSQFLVKYLGDSSSINIQQDELKKAIWVNIKESFKYLVFPNQLKHTKELFKEFELL